jgi:hypothetical protein
MKVKPIVTDATDADEVPSRQSGDVKRVTSAERVRRCRRRKKTGQLLLTVEISPEILDLLAYGMKTTTEALIADRAALNSAATRTLRYFAKRFAETGRVPY